MCSDRLPDAAARRKSSGGFAIATGIQSLTEPEAAAQP
jgi:hypothetical protein